MEKPVYRDGCDPDCVMQLINAAIAGAPTLPLLIVSCPQLTPLVGNDFGSTTRKLLEVIQIYHTWLHGGTGGDEMKPIAALIAVSAQIPGPLWYAVRAVTHRNDRRAPCQSSADALLGAAALLGRCWCCRG